VIVVDASAAMSALLDAGPARDALAIEQLHAPHLIDAEVAHGVRRLVGTGQLDAGAGWRALDTLRHTGITRYPVFTVLDRMWDLRDSLSAYDATYVALAEMLDCTLMTADGRLARAPGLRCSVTVVPSRGKS
jgi:predicted nucleic acid-binding protein